MARERNAQGELINDTWATPPEVVRALARMLTPCSFFDIDVCADASNAKAKYYIDRETDALAPGISWRDLLINAGWAGAASERYRRMQHIHAFCNPGYSNVLPWCQRAYKEARDHNVATYILAHDNFTGPWFRHAVRYATDIYLLYPRIQFIPPPGVPESTNARCSTVLVYAREYSRTCANIEYVSWLPYRK